MSVAIYVDHNVRAEIVAGLRRVGIDCLTAAEDRSRRTFDTILLDRSTSPGRVPLTTDEDFLRITAEWLIEGRRFARVIYLHQRRLTIGRAIGQVQIIVFCSDAQELQNTPIRLPL